jgi:protein-L-isoaspartate(D-aspartate) O-methyltransferase
VDPNSERARFNMIQQQIRPWEVLDERVLAVMEAVPREPFVPDAYQGLAYADIEIPLNAGDAEAGGPYRAMLAPKVVGRMLQALEVRAGDKVLVVGCGSGYETACLRRLGGRVIATETDPALLGRARERLADLERVELLEHDALASPTAGRPFDVIAVNGSLADARVLAVLIDQLASGGRLFCVVGRGPMMEARLVRRVGPRDLRTDDLFETAAPPLVPAPAPAPFTF